MSTKETITSSILIKLIRVSLGIFMNPRRPTIVYTLSLHDALPISAGRVDAAHGHPREGHQGVAVVALEGHGEEARRRSEEHTSELQSRPHLVCRLLLEKKNR